jgi:hypothetical protein
MFKSWLSEEQDVRPAMAAARMIYEYLFFIMICIS